MSLCANVSYEKEFGLHENEHVGGTHLSMNGFARKSRFHTEAKGNLDSGHDRK